MLKNAFLSILNIGIKEGTPNQTIYLVQSSNFLALVAVTIGIIYISFFAIYIPVKYLYFSMVCVMLFNVTFLLNSKGFYSLAKVNVWLICNLIFFWMSSAIGYESKSHFFFFTILEIAWLDYHHRKTTQIVILTIIPLACLAILFFTHFSLFQIPNVSPNSIHKISIFNFFITFGAFIIGLAFFSREVQLNTQTQIKSEEIIRSKYQELQKTNEELDKFVYSVSHDLRAPITSMIGLLDLIRMNKAAADKYLNLQEKNLKKLEIFISDILTHSRNSRLEITPTEIDFQLLINESLEKNHPNDTSEIALHLDIPPNYSFYSDEYRLSIIFDNLISNAIKYHNPQTKITNIEIIIRFYQNFVSIQVKDNGIGINEKYLPKIFDMFYRANTQFMGSGLGLYIVKEAVTKLKGKISVVSVLNQGTTFTLLLPILYVVPKPTHEAYKPQNLEETMLQN